MDKKKVSLLIGIVLIIVAGALIFLKSQQSAEEGVPMAQGPQEISYVNVVVAARDIRKGDVIERDAVKPRKTAASAVKNDELTSPELAVGKIATTDIMIGESIVRTKIAVRPSQQQLSMKVPEGKRAMTIPIDKISSLEGMIRPGDKIDVVGTFPFTQAIAGKNVTQQVVVPMFENILVLAVGSSFVDYEERPVYSTITFAFTPEESSLMIFATQIGKIRMLLRSPMDLSKARVKTPVNMDVLWQKLLSIEQQQLQSMREEPKQEEKKDLPKPVIDVYVGGVKGN